MILEKTNLKDHSTRNGFWISLVVSTSGKLVLCITACASSTWTELHLLTEVRAYIINPSHYHFFRGTDSFTRDRLQDLASSQAHKSSVLNSSLYASLEVYQAKMITERTTRLSIYPLIQCVKYIIEKNHAFDEFKHILTFFASVKPALQNIIFHVRAIRDSILQ